MVRGTTPLDPPLLLVYFQVIYLHDATQIVYDYDLALVFLRLIGEGSGKLDYWIRHVMLT